MAPYGVTLYLAQHPPHPHPQHRYPEKGGWGGIPGRLAPGLGGPEEEEAEPEQAEPLAVGGELPYPVSKLSSHSLPRLIR